MKHLLLLLCALAIVTGCASKKKKKPERTGQATLIGMIEMVNPEQNYVLIRCEPMPSLAEGTELIAVSASGEKSKLVLTPERKGYYITADIKEGNPGVSNLVLHQHSATAPVLPQESPVSPAPAPPSPSSFQPMPSLPGIMPGVSGETSLTPLAPLPQAVPTPKQPAEAAPKGFDDLEPPVGGPPR
jgi:hypothetical protein